MDLYPHSYYFCTRCDCKSQVWKFTGGTYCDSCGHTGHQHFCYWLNSRFIIRNREILKPIQKYGNLGDGLQGFKKLGSVLDQIMLRRTKINYNDELGLPPRIVESRRDLFSPAEEELYKSLYSDSTREFSTYVNLPFNTIIGRRRHSIEQLCFNLFITLQDEASCQPS
jgi:DNA repair protein RAD16